MNLFTRLTLVPVLFVALLGFALHSAQSVEAQNAFTVKVIPPTGPIPVGTDAIFTVRVEGQTITLPSFQYDVEGGIIAGVASIDPIAANVAEGTIFVTRDSEGLARLEISFAGQVLATGETRFANMGAVSIAVSVEAGDDAAARTWRYEVLNASDQLVATLQANTSGDSPSQVLTTASLPYGFYTVRQVFGSDTRTACGAGVFYQVAAPASGQTTLELNANTATVNFVIRPCPDLPTDLGVIIPIDTVGPPAPGGVLGDAVVAPGDTPISEVRGTRQAGPGAEPLAPAVGNSMQPATAPASLHFSLALAGLALLTVAAGTGALAFAKR